MNRDFTQPVMGTTSTINGKENTYDVAAEPFIGKDAAEDAYDRMPIDLFGKSVLSKLGWQEGKAIGRTNME